MKFVKIIERLKKISRQRIFDILCLGNVLLMRKCVLNFQAFLDSDISRKITKKKQQKFQMPINNSKRVKIF